MCTNLVNLHPGTVEAPAEEAMTGGTTPATPPLPEGLDPPVDHRIQCMAHMVGHNRMMVGACGCEQTKITFTLTDKIAGYGGLNINSVTTNRAEGAAGSFFILSDIRGDAARLQRLARDFAVTPWLDPHGVRVVPEKVFDLRIIAPDRCNLLRDALQVISIEYGVNIETMVNRTFRDIWRDELNTLDVAEEETPLGAANRVRGGDYTGLISVTQMRLEAPAGTNMDRLKRELLAVGRGWDFTWTPRTDGGEGIKGTGRPTAPNTKQDAVVPVFTRQG